MTKKKIVHYLIIWAVSIIGAFLLFWIWYVYSWIKYIPPHYHANFALYVNGLKVDLSADKYMEDVAGCSLTWKVYPASRVHMHNNDDDSIHIHAAWVSWEHFFNNIAYNIGPDFIYSKESGLIENNTNNSLQFVLNGKKVDFPLYNLINSEDTLLVYYWNKNDENLLEAFGTINQDASEYNSKYDPGSCGGTNENGIVVLVHNLFESFTWTDHQH